MKQKTKRTINIKVFDYALIGTSAIFLLSLIYNRVIPFNYRLIAMMVVVILMSIGLLVSSRVAKGILAFLILVGSLGIFYIQMLVNQVANIEQYETNTVSLVVLRESPYETIDDLNPQTSFSVSNSFNEALFVALQEEIADKVTINGNVTRHNDDIAVTQALYSGEIEVMILDEAHRGILVETQTDFDSRTRVIYSYEKHDEKDDIAKPVDVKKEGFTVYISGIDVQGSVSAVSRSDVNILMTVNPTTNEILLTTTPRDSFVTLGCFPDSRPDKLTHAGVYGVGCSVSTLENLYDIDINYYAKVNFTSFVNIIDVLGSIEVYSHYTFTTRSGHYFEQGMNEVNSEQALAFARERYNVPGGDLTRGIHQQEVIKGVINKMTQPSVLLNIQQIINRVSSSVDTNIGSANLSKLVEKQLGDGKGWKFETVSLEGVGAEDYTYSYPHQLLYVYYPDETSINNIHNQIIDTIQRVTPQ